MRGRRPARHALAAASLVLAAAGACRTPPPSIPDPLVVRMTGDDHEWHLTYPGPDGEFDTPDDVRAERHLHLPADTRVELHLESRDFVYTLSLPHWDLRQVAVPDLEFSLELASGPPGTHELAGNQLCGRDRPHLAGEVRVEPAERFVQWLAEQRLPDDG